MMPVVGPARAARRVIGVKLEWMAGWGAAQLPQHDADFLTLSAVGTARLEADEVDGAAICRNRRSARVRRSSPARSAPNRSRSFAFPARAGACSAWALRGRRRRRRGLDAIAVLAIVGQLLPIALAPLCR
jgi:hypothetical protein